MLVGKTGYFSGYASIFGQPDQGGDIVMPGAFVRSLRTKGTSGIRMLFQHDPKQPVGRLLSVYEDAKGLLVKGQLLLDVPKVHSLGQLISGGALDGLSIGFRTVRASRDRRTGYRRLYQIDLWEISIVTFPMMEQARISSALKPPDQKERSERSPAQTIRAAISLFSNPQEDLYDQKPK